MVIRALLLATAIGLLTSQLAAAQTLATYDDFSTPSIDPRRWFGREQVVRYASLLNLEGGWYNATDDLRLSHPAYAVANTYALRRIVSGQLQLALTTHGGHISDPNIAPGHGRLELRTGRDGPDWPLAAFQARVTVVSAEAAPCRTTAASRTRAQLFIHLFNDGVRAASDKTGDVFASLSLERSSFNGDRVVAVLSRCRNAACTIADDLDWVVFTRSWALGTAHVLTITHRPETDQVVFTVTGGGLTTETRTLTYPAATEARPAASRRALRVENTPASCPASGTAPGERVRVRIDARFDTVRFDATARSGGS